MSARTSMRLSFVAMALAAGAAMAQLAGAPTIPPTPAWSAPIPLERKLASGARAWVLSKPGLPLVHVNVVVSAGSLTDPSGKPGLAALTATALEEGGAGDKSPEEVLATFDALGTELDVTPGSEAVTLSFTVLSPKLEPAMRQLSELLAKPRFDAKAFGSVHERRLSEIAEQRSDPRALASEVLLGTMYGAGPRGHTALGTQAAVGPMTRDDAMSFYKAQWLPSRVTFVLVGDVTADGAQKLIDGLMPKAWLANAPAPAPVVNAVSAPSWVAVDKPGAAQTVLRLGRQAFAAKDPRVPATEMVSKVLGGSFTSRLVQNLREKHGYTYGAGAYLAGGSDDGMLGVATSVKTEVTAEALEQLIIELKGITTLSPGDLAKAKALIEAQLVDALGSGAAASMEFGGQASVGLPPDKLSKASADLAAVTADQAVAAAKSYAPEGFTLVIIGDKARIEKGLAKTFPGQTITWQR